MRLNIIAVVTGLIVTIVIVVGLMAYSKENNISEKQIAQQFNEFIHHYLEEPIASAISQLKHG